MTTTITLWGQPASNTVHSCKSVCKKVIPFSFNPYTSLHFLLIWTVGAERDKWRWWLQDLSSNEKHHLVMFKHNSHTITSQKEQKNHSNAWIAVSLINQYNYTEYKPKIQHKKREKKSNMKRRECQLYFVIFGESSKAEIKVCAFQTYCLFWCLIFYHNTLQFIGKAVWFQVPFCLVFLLITAM